MNSLYDIQQHLLNIFNQIEELEGELTPELDKQLEITQEDYRNKLENYAKVVTQYEADLLAIKEEKARLDARKKVIENRVKHLKEVMLNAITEFGPVETPLFKIGTRKSNSVELDDTRVNTLSREVFKFARELHANSIIAFGEDCDIDGMLKVINQNIEAELAFDGKEDEFIPYTIDDLLAVKVNINSESNIADLFTNKGKMLQAVLDNEMAFNIQDSTTKTDVKNLSKSLNNITIGKIETKTNLSIR